MSLALRAPRIPCLVTLLALLCTMLAAATTARAASAPDLRSRIVLDGYTQDFTDDEAVFGHNGAITSVETAYDSWWQHNELRQVRVTWDRQAVYVGVEGVCSGNNVVLVIDVVPNQGLADMTMLNSWRRNILFSSDFQPDAFLATWDTNPSPRLVLHSGGVHVWDLVTGSRFQSAASFNESAPGRAMEGRIPWTTLFMASANGTPVVRDTVLEGLPDTLVFLPAGMQLRLAAVLTAAWDGSGGPDVAPNNLTGCSSYANNALLVDNFAIVMLDADADGLPDMGVEPILRVGFKDTSVPVRLSTWGAVKARYR